MKILALETSTSEGGIAILDGENVLSEYQFKTNENFGQNFFSLIGDLLKKATVTLNEIELICVNTGPGSYTGMRVGITCANTLSWANKIPIVGVSCLYVMGFANKNKGEVQALIYGNDKDAFLAKYSYDGVQFKILQTDKRVTWTELSSQILKNQTTIYFAAKKNQPLCNLESVIEWSPAVKDVALSGLNLFLETKEKSYGTTLPNYLKEFEVTPKQK